MESNIANKIKLFENAKIQYTNPFDVNTVDSIQVIEEKKVKLTSPPIAKPRHRKIKPTQTEQAEYINITPEVEAATDSGTDPSSDSSFNHYLQFDSTQAAYDSGLQDLDLALPEYANFSHYPELDTTQLGCDSLQPFDLEQSEYANLLPLGTTDEKPKQRIYANPEGYWLSIQEKQSKKSTAKETSIEAAQSVEYDLANSEYANLIPLGMSAKEPRELIYLDPEGRWITIKGKQTEQPSSLGNLIGLTHSTALDL